MIEPINKNRVEATDWQFKSEVIDKINEVIAVINSTVEKIDDFFDEDRKNNDNDDDGSNNIQQ